MERGCRPLATYLNEHFVWAFLFTLFAGLATGIGSLIAFFSRRTNRTFLSGALGFSSGVMIYVSFIEIFNKARDWLIEEYNLSEATWITVLSFFGGMVVIAIIDRLVPSYENPHEARILEEVGDLENRKLLRMGKLSALAIAVHNFPEGLATFVSAMSDISIAIPITIAIALHNIPEGISVSVPIYYATGNRRKAFWLSFLSGISEPVGALAGYIILRPFFSVTTLGVLFASVAGIMVFISLDELFPTAREYGKGHVAVYGLVSGMAVMALSLLLLA
jgi:ZIP family zinc transporter